MRGTRIPARGIFSLTSPGVGRKGREEGWVGELKAPRDQRVMNTLGIVEELSTKYD